ncbi:hypothetical protein GX50_05075 [[Emmonsia] crescens]|uniref:Uncharacterized protein n=1 Tax=[Emmonsia] crescens TaxID=73230 RepID=A0A2B7Z6U7_9EURO|nr:hypothetical protein GX50_05075 [Emmonsia crescens]
MPRQIYLGIISNGPRPASHRQPSHRLLPRFPAKPQFYRARAGVDERLVSNNVPAAAAATSDSTARDQLESVAIGVPPPGRSVDPLDRDAPNCQTWIRAYVDELVRRGFFPAEAKRVLENAKRNFAAR